MKEEKWKMKNGTGICTLELLLRIINGGLRISEFKMIKERGVGEGENQGKWRKGEIGSREGGRERCVRGFFSAGNNIFNDDDDGDS
jgi:hypothetical protein